MRPLLISILIISNFYLSAQSVTDTIINDIVHALRVKQVSALNSYIEAEKHSNFIHWETLRDVVGNIQEGVLKIQIIRKPDSTGNVDNFSITLLADRNRIIFYELKKCIFKSKRKDNGHYDSYSVSVDTYKDLSAYQNFENLFVKTYYSLLDTADLFLTSVVFGNSCGLFGTPTEYQKKLDSMLLHKDLSTLSAWLKSLNMEKQLYAIKGFYMLQARNEYQVSDEEREIMYTIAHKNGNVQTCNGCIYSSKPINELINEIDATIGHFSFTNPKLKGRLIYLSIVLTMIVVIIFYFWKIQCITAAK